MAHVRQLPCNTDGECMICKTKPPMAETITCTTCTAPWHSSCLAVLPETIAATVNWECPDCTAGATCSAPAGENGELVAAIRAIEADASLTAAQKAARRQQLLAGESGKVGEEEETGGNDGVLSILSETLRCAFCMQLPERPVTTECAHNFCLKCFKKWMARGKHECPKCRASISPKFAKNPRINLTLVQAIRDAKASQSDQCPQTSSTSSHDQNRPDKAFTTPRAKRGGLANASSGRMMVTVPHDHFGPIMAQNDPERNQGVLVGEYWMSRMEVRQWGVHIAHIAGITGQSKLGAQSVVLSGGYKDDEDHGEWFLYTGSGGRDLTGNKRTNKKQSFDQEFVNSNQALRLSCTKGYPVRVVRAYKDKHSSYAPQEGYRYDGIYRIEKCWRKTGMQGYIVCRYLFVRCDNEPAPWTSEEHGDRPRPLPDVPELVDAIDIFERTESPSWDFDEEESSWKWKKPPPSSEVHGAAKRKRQREGEGEDQEECSQKDKHLLTKFSCHLCKKVMNLPVTTPCGHSFCKTCLEDNFKGQSHLRDRSTGGRNLRVKKNILVCPQCPMDISDFLLNPKVNAEMNDLIQKLQLKTKMEVKTSDNSHEEAPVEVEDLSVGEDAKVPTEDRCDQCTLRQTS